MTDPIPGGDGWARTVVEGATEGEGGRVPGSPSTSSAAGRTRPAAPASDDMEAEIVELDDLDPTNGAAEAGVPEEVNDTDGDVQPDDVVDEADELEDLEEDVDVDAEADADDNGPEAEHDSDGEVDPDPDPDVEVDPDLEASASADASAPGSGDEMTVEDLVNDLERVSVERDQYLDASRRLQAEFENYKKQVSKREANARERANDTLVEELLPILDAFDGAVANGAEDVAPMRTTMLDALAKQGLERIDPSESSFDPTLHEAVMHEDGDEADGPVVAEVLRAGYSWKGRVLRPAMVKTRG